MGRRGDLAAHANDADDDPAAARSHPLHHRIDDVDVGKELGVERRPPRRRGQFVRGRSRGRAGGIDEDVDRADAALDRLNHRPRGRGVGEIGGDAECAIELRAGSLDIVA
jgi:hypothetical protein